MGFKFVQKNTLEKFLLKIKNGINLLEAKLIDEYFYKELK